MAQHYTRDLERMHARVDVLDGNVILRVGDESYSMGGRDAEALSRMLKGASKCADPQPRADSGDALVYGWHYTPVDVSPTTS